MQERMQESLPQYPVIAFTGAGNMAGALIRGLVAGGYPPDNIIATRRTLSALQSLKDETGVRVSADNGEAVSQAGVVVAGVKPVQVTLLLSGLRKQLGKTRPLMISLAAGVTLAQLEAAAGPGVPVVRAMPNTPVAVRLGITALVAGAGVSPEQHDCATQLFAAAGSVHWLEREDDIHAFTALAGSGPAYLFLFIEALAEAAVQTGMQPEQAMQLARDMVHGAAVLCAGSDASPQVLRREVTSPGGVTASAIKAFEDGKLRALVAQAIEAAVRRSREMACDENL